MLSPQEACLESTAERIARIITKEYNVSVRVEGHMAYIDLDTMTIVLPNLVGDDLEHVKHVMDGFLDHECGHAIYTDNAVVKRLKADPILFRFWNPIEDSWIEREHGSKFVGVWQNLKALNDAIAVENYKKWDEADPVFRTLFALHEVWRGAHPASKFEGDPNIGEMFKMLGPELRDGFTVKSTQQAADLAQRVLDKIKDLAEPPPPQPQPEPKGDQGEGGDQEGEEQGQDGEQSENGGSGSQNGGQDDEEGPQDGEDGDQAPMPGPLSPGGPQEAENEPGQDEPQNANGDQEEAQAQAREMQNLIDAEDFDQPLDAESFFNECLPDTPSKAKSGDPEHYIVFSEEFDTETEYTGEQRMVWTDQYRNLRNEVHDYLGNMATALELALAAEAEARWVGGARRGRKFDKRVFPTWYMGGRDDRIYRQREQHETWDTAVSLLWDCSGSMQTARPGTKSYIARLAAIAFHEALTRSDIAHEVLGFNTGEADSPESARRIEAARKRGEDLAIYSRLEGRDKRMIFVPWGSPDGRAICAINGGHANRDGECVKWAAKRLASRPEKRKVLIVGSDGRPSGARYGYTEEKYLQEVVKDVINAGIEVYAIGIKDKSVKKYYPQWVIINRIEDLPGAVMRQLAQALFAHKGTNHANVSEIKRPTR